MRTNLFAFLLISSLVLGSFPFAHAQEAPAPEPTPAVEPTPEPTPEPVVEEPVTPEPTPVLEEPAPEVPVETVPVIEEVVVTAATEAPAASSTISLTVRYGENVAWNGTVDLPEGGTVAVTPTGESTSVDIAADSLLAILLEVDAASDAFSVTDLDYFPSFGSFLVNCISATSFGSACSEWQYVIDGVYPFVGIDDYVLSDGDQVFIYFGSPRRVVLGDSDIRVNESFTATAESYDPATNAYSPLPGYTIGVTQPDPDNPWSPLEIATSTSGTDGTATFSLTSEGTYGIGLKEDFYFPSVSFTVASSTGGESGGGGPTPGLNYASAYAFLKTGQQSDGSWNTPIVTDWTAIALGISGAPSDMKNALASYLKEERVDLDSALDYERHAMALMALGINPYTGGPEDYIAPLVAKFDGNQMDDPTIVNDDAFAIITLLNAGYTKDDEIIRDMTAFLVSRQKSDGSWTGGVDLSGAYIQALKLVPSLPGVSSALSKAESYMRAQQNADGGFGSPSDPFATSWALQGIRALGSSPDAWSKGEATPLTYLVDHQDKDGGMDVGKDSYDDRAWATAYAIPAAKGMTWAEILKNFAKPKGITDSGSGDSNNAATSTDETIVVDPLPEPLIEAYVATSTRVADVPETETLVAVPEGAAAPQVSGSETTETVPEEVSTPDTTAAAGDTGAWEWLKDFFSSLWSFLRSLF